VTAASELAREVVAARARLVEFVGRCTDDQWTTRPLADDPRAVAVIVDHVADAYEYLGSFVGKLSRGASMSRYQLRSWTTSTPDTPRPCSC
jgi:hypothetical protein